MLSRTQLDLFVLPRKFATLSKHTNLGGVSQQRIVAASSLKHVPEKVLLTVVSSENGDLFGGVSERAHVHESGHDKLSFSQVLVEVRVGFRFTNTVEIFNVDDLTTRRKEDRIE